MPSLSLGLFHSRLTIIISIMLLLNSIVIAITRAKVSVPQVGEPLLESTDKRGVCHKGTG